MIVVDIETSGISPENNGIWQIGAIELENPENTFLQESKIDSEDKVDPEALPVIGKTEAELRNPEKQNQEQLVKNFFDWVSKTKNPILVAHNTPFDYGFLTFKARKYGLKIPFNYKTLDLHSIGFQKYLEINKTLPIEEDKSKLNLSAIIEMCGLKDTRIQLKDGKIIQEGTPHNGLEDAKMEAECLNRLLFGKPLLRDFSSFN
jgi:DNA polymerase III epsilon subunit-like protein